MEVSGIVAEEGNACCSSSTSNSYDAVTTTEMENTHQEDLFLPSLIQKETEEEETSHCEKVAETLGTEPDLIEEETSHFEKMAETFGMECDPVEEASGKSADSYGVEVDRLDEETFHCEKVAETLGMECDPVAEEISHCEKVAENRGTECDPVEEETSHCEKEAETLRMECDPIEEANSHCGKVAETIGAERDPVEEKTSRCEIVAENVMECNPLEEETSHCEKVAETCETERDSVEEASGKATESCGVETDRVDEETTHCEKGAETLGVECDPVEEEASGEASESYGVDINQVDEKTSHCEKGAETLGTEHDPVEEKTSDCEKEAETLRTEHDPIEEKTSHCEKGAETLGTEHDPVEEKTSHCEKGAETLGTEHDPVEEKTSDREKEAETLGTEHNPIEEKTSHCEKGAESLGMEHDPVEEKIFHCEKVTESFGGEVDKLKETFHCEEAAESHGVEINPVDEGTSHCEKVAESLGTESESVEEVASHYEKASESHGVEIYSVDEENSHREKLAESIGPGSDPAEEETSHCEKVVENLGMECDPVHEEEVSEKQAESRGVEINLVDEETSHSGKVAESLEVGCDLVEDTFICEKVTESLATESDLVNEENSSCINLPASPVVEENEVIEEEIPPAEAVTLYCHDVDSQEYSVESQSADPLALDQENGDPSSIIIKDEPIDDREEVEILPPEDIVEEMCIKIESVQERSLAFGELVPFGDKEYTQDSNLDNIQSATCSENDYDSFLQNPSDFSSQISTLDNVPKLRVKDFGVSSAGISKDVILGHEPFEIGEGQENNWHSVTIMKQEDGEQNFVNSAKNQVMNSYMVNIPHLGFNKCQMDTMPGVFACKFCGKAFHSAAAHNGHLSKCPKRKRYQAKRLNLISRRNLKKQKNIESSPLSLPSSQQICEDSVKPTVQLRNSYHTKKNYLHYDCDLCEKAFPTLQGFAIHSRRHVETGKEYKCLNCRESFSSRQKLSLHCKRSGHRCKKFKCSMCSKIFYTKLSLSKHEQVHDTDYLFCCVICDKSFENALKLQRHQEQCQLAEKKCHDVKKSTNCCSCSVCGQTYKSAKRLIRHMRWHANEKHNACPVCKKKFLNKNNLKQHKILHQQEGKYCCDMCDKVFESLAYLRKHVFRHTGNVASTQSFTCDKCHQSYSSISGLWGHSAHCRGKRLKKRKFLTGDKSTVTSKFHNYRPVQNEVIILNSKIKIKIKREETQQVLKNINLPPTKDSKSKLMKCDLCKKSYSSRRNLDRHRQIHFGQMVSDTENTKLCGICGNVFSSNITLQRHERLHRVGKQFRCLICRKLFPASRNLKIHMHIHRTEDKELFNCDICNKAFSSEIHLKYHRRTHTGNTNVKSVTYHKCQKCYKSFTTFQGLNGHRRFCPFRYSALEHTSARVGETPKEYSVKQNMFLTPRSTVKRNNNERNVSSTLLRSPKELKVSLTNAYACNVCSKKFSSQVLLKYHLRQHSSEASLTCINCKKTFETLRGLSGHLSHCAVRHIVMAGLQSRHDETLQCHICEKTTNNLENFMSHMRTHAKDLSFDCDFCGKVLSTSQARRIHIKRHHSDSEISMITQPEKPITSVRRASSKQVTATPQKHGASSSHSPRNVVSIKNALPISDLSSLGTNYKNYFIKRGSQGSEKYECKVCNKQLLSKKNLKFHSYLHSGESPYKCDICSTMMHSSAALRTHINRKHGMSNHTKISDEVDYGTPKNFKNQTGKIKYKNSSKKLNSIFIKEEILQGTPGKRMFQCNFCPRTFGGISKLQTHEASHSRALKCSVCGGSFRTHREFKEHVCADNFFPLLCEHCGVQFTEESSFTSHSCDFE